MDKYQLMIYGAGNSEIAQALEEEMNAIYQLRNVEMTLYAKSYILANSCLALYKRFGQMKDAIEGVKDPGVFEYIYEGREDGVKTQQLHMGECSNPVAFEDFLEKGLSYMEGEQIILMLIGQSYGNGIFLDFFTGVPTQLTYEDFFDILGRVGRKRKVYFHLVMDIGLWNGMILPYEVAQLPCIASLFIWEKSEALKVFPITNWIERSLGHGENWLKELYKDYKGYQINTHSVWWKLCKMKWENYKENPCITTWKQFYENYRNLISYKGENIQAITKPLHHNEEQDYRKDGELTFKQLRDYLEQLYEEQVEDEEMIGWLEEMKNCISYYKL